ncbi:MAG: acyltransferase [Lachnospiraceae bacterium]|nr:acyltransferase [Candidatus Colinaster equi]
MANQKERFNAVQALRFICFFFVFGLHAGIPYVGTSVWTLSVFFMLSGFMMVYSYADRDLKCTFKDNFKFMTKRVGKLYPLHIAMAIVMVGELLLFQNAADYALYFLVVIPVNLLLLQAWVPWVNGFVFSLNGPSWYLSASMFSFFIFPWELKIIKKLGSIKKLLIVSGVLMVLGYAVTYVAGVNMNFEGDVFIWLTQHFPIMRAVEVFIGAVAGYIYVENSDKIKAAASKLSCGVWTVIEILVIVLVVFSDIYAIWANNYTWGKALVFCRTVVPVITSLIVIYVFVLNRGMVTKLLDNKVLRYLGDISMYLYMFHYIFCVNKALVGKFGWVIEGWFKAFMITAELGLTILCSALYDKYAKGKKAKGVKAS